LREHTRELSSENSGLRDRLEKIYRDAGLAAPSLNEALERAGAQQGRKILQLLIDSGLLIKVHGEMFFHRAALDDLIKKVRAYGATHEAIDVAAFKDLAGISRKYAIPLLEYLDRQRVTRREGDRRIVL
jgi:selenocysteine-specific elongation factor